MHPTQKHPYPTLKSNLTLHDYTLIATTNISHHDSYLAKKVSKQDTQYFLQANKIHLDGNTTLAWIGFYYDINPNQTCLP